MADLTAPGVTCPHGRVTVTDGVRMIGLRIANLVHAGVETLAIELRGDLLDVAAVERRLGLDASPGRFTGQASSFRQRVFSLGLAGLDDVAEGLGDGRPPADALLNPKLCLFLPPTLPNRSLIEFDVLANDPIPRLRWGSARVLQGHDAPLRVPTDETAPQIAVQVAAVLGEDLRSASVEEARRAIAGFAPLCLWTFPSREKLSPGWGRNRVGQLGPFLVATRDPFDPTATGINVSVGGRRVLSAKGRPWRWTFPELVAFASEGVDLLAGDVIASGPLVRCSSDGGRALRDRDVVSVEVEGLGRLSGMIVASDERSHFLG